MYMYESSEKFTVTILKHTHKLRYSLLAVADISA